MTAFRFCAGLLCGLAAAGAQTAYRPAVLPAEPSMLSVWGSDEMAPMMLAWEKAFERAQPAVRFHNVLKGTETAQAALFAHVAELAPMSRPILPLERHVMFRREHHLPTEVAVAMGSAAGRDRNYALAILVAKSNPLDSVTVEQLDGVFGAERSGAWDEQFLWHKEFARGPEKNVRTWGGLGLTGEWARRPVHAYGFPVTIYSPTSGPMLSFRMDVMQGGDMWNPDLKEYPTAKEIADALRRDPEGIAYGCACDAGAELKVLAVAPRGGGSAVRLTEATVADGSYPLARPVYVSIDRTPGEPVEARVREFLRYALSADGQRMAAGAGGYVALTGAARARELEKLQ